MDERVPRRAPSRASQCEGPEGAAGAEGDHRRAEAGRTPGREHPAAHMVGRSFKERTHDSACGEQRQQQAGFGVGQVQVPMDRGQVARGDEDEELVGEANEQQGRSKPERQPDCGGQNDGRHPSLGLLERGKNSAQGTPPSWC